MAYKKNGIWLTALAILTAAVIWVSACAPKAAPVPPAVPTTGSVTGSTSTPMAQVPGTNPAEADWAKVVSAAQREGQLTIYSDRAGGDTWKDMVGVFTSRYGIKVQGIAARGAELLERMKVEQRTGQAVADLVIGGPTSAVAVSKEGFTASLLDLPEVRQQGIWMSSPAYDPQALVLFFSITPPFFPVVNTKLVKPDDEPRTWQDLLQPRWKGQILMDDPSVTGGGNIWTGLSLEYKIFDMAYLEKLARQDVVLTRNYTEAFTMIGTGERAMALAQPLHQTFVSFVVKGAPLKAVDIKDGGVTSAYVVNMPKKPAHLNAARLFANWLLTEEGQIAWSREMQYWPIRKGVPVATHPSLVFKNPTRIVIPTAEDNEAIVKYVREGSIGKLFKK